MGRPRVVAYQEIESPQARVWRHCVTGEVDEEDVPLRPRGLGRYWCAADKPQYQDEGFRIAPVYQTNKIDPVDAECQECGISIKDLQDELRTLFS